MLRTSWGDGKKDPFRDQCKPKVKNGKVKFTTSLNASNRAKHERRMGTEDFKYYARLRNGVETVPSNIRKNYRLDKLPRGKQRGKFFFQKIYYDTERFPYSMQNIRKAWHLEVVHLFRLIPDISLQYPASYQDRKPSWKNIRQHKKRILHTERNQNQSIRSFKLSLISLYKCSQNSNIFMWIIS